MQLSLRTIDVEINPATAHRCKGGCEIQYFNQAAVNQGRNGVLSLKEEKKTLGDHCQFLPQEEKGKID